VPVCQLPEGDGFEIQSERFRFLPARAAGLPKRGDVVEVDTGGALRSGTQKVGRLGEGRDIPMDQESRWIRNRVQYDRKGHLRLTEEETRPVEAIRASSEPPAVRSERFEGVHRLP
jgi:hypothetical protein